jgi:glycosyltransferase involved in cell wall biosynthesis
LGEGGLRGELLQQIRTLGLEGVVHLPGSQTPAALADWYRAADLTVLPSLSEGVPNVLLESIACGRPFVASNVGGVPEIADPQLDRLVPPKDPDALAAAIQERLSQASDAGRPRRFAPMTWRDSADRVAAILRGDTSSSDGAENRRREREHENVIA